VRQEAVVDTKLKHVSDVQITSGLPGTTYYAIKADRFVGKHEARLAKPFGLTQFGVNRVTLDPGAMSALRHWHEAEDEFVYVLSGRLTLIDNNGEHALEEGSFAAFPAGVANGHHLVNTSSAPATFLVVGSRKPGEETIHYPDDDFGPIRK
jgi:uncharacterized cupin superfamily protein